MRILIIGGPQKPFAEMSPADINGAPTLYAYYLRRELERAGHETVHCNIGSASLDPGESRRFYDALQVARADHALCVEQRGFFNRHPYFTGAIRRSVKGCVATICDNNARLGPEDVTFYAVPCPAKPRSVWIGWAADPELCRPRQPPISELRLLIDHAYYSDTPLIDKSKEIAQEVWGWSRNRPRVCVRRFVSGGAETMERLWFDAYNRRGLSYPDACAEYSQAHVFFVTHQESMGLSVVESAMAGALVVVPAGCIRPELLDGIRHVKYTGAIPWVDILASIDTEKSRRSALQFDRWEEMAAIILRTFKEHDHG